MFEKIWDLKTPNENSRWSFDPKRGLTLKKSTILDAYSHYYFVGSMPDVVNGKRVNIKTRDEYTEEFLNWFSQFDDVNATDVILFHLYVAGTTRNNKKLLSSLANYNFIITFKKQGWN